MRPRRRSTPDIGIAMNGDESQAIIDSLNLIEAGNMIDANDVVVITPNWVKPSGPETGDVVGPESLRTIIRFVKQKNPRRIVVATGSAERTTADVMKAVGYDRIIREEQVEFVDLNYGPFVRVSLNHTSPPSTNLNKLYEEMTFLISFAQLKIHNVATMTAAIKNIALGWPPAEEHGYPKKNLGIHDDLHGFISAMAQVIPIDLSIVSTNPAMIGTGPHNGIPRRAGIVISGTDPVAVDTVAARFLGFHPEAVRYLWDLKNKNVGVADINQMNIKGMPLADAERAFSVAAYGQAFTVE